MNEKDEERMKGIEDAMKTLTEQVQALVKAQETEKETQKNREEDAEKSLVETLVGKLTEIDEKVSKLSKESTGRDSGIPIEIANKKWDDLTTAEKSEAWGIVIKGG